MDEEGIEQVEVEWLILADAAEVSNGKLYLMGGGWDRLTVNSLETAHQKAIALSIVVPWTEANTQHGFALVLETADGTQLSRGDGQFTVGRPADTEPGQLLRTQIVLGMGMKFSELGTYVVRSLIDETERRTFTFRVLPGPGFKKENKEPPAA